jgi:hypothetical protein
MRRVQRAAAAGPNWAHEAPSQAFDAGRQQASMKASIWHRLQAQQASCRATAQRAARWPRVVARVAARSGAPGGDCRPRARKNLTLSRRTRWGRGAGPASEGPEVSLPSPCSSRCPCCSVSRWAVARGRALPRRAVLRREPRAWLGGLRCALGGLHALPGGDTRAGRRVEAGMSKTVAAWGLSPFPPLSQSARFSACPVSPRRSDP